MDGFYYLHVNGDLIFKRFMPEGDSPFVKKIWPLDVSDRANAWLIAIEALALGADKGRVAELAEKWGLTDDDAQVFCQKAGLRVFKDGDAFCATFPDFENVQESQCGFGATALEALAGLAEGGMLDATPKLRRVVPEGSRAADVAGQ